MQERRRDQAKKARATTPRRTPEEGRNPEVMERGRTSISENKDRLPSRRRNHPRTGNRADLEDGEKRKTLGGERETGPGTKGTVTIGKPMGR